jgi:hypothetical protein
MLWRRSHATDPISGNESRSTAVWRRKCLVIHTRRQGTKGTLNFYPLSLRAIFWTKCRAADFRHGPEAAPLAQGAFAYATLPTPVRIRACGRLSGAWHCLLAKPGRPRPETVGAALRTARNAFGSTLPPRMPPVTISACSRLLADALALR